MLPHILDVAFDDFRKFNFALVYLKLYILPKLSLSFIKFCMIIDYVLVSIVKLRGRFLWNGLWVMCII
jgi:hypothetical protein